MLTLEKILQICTHLTQHLCHLVWETCPLGTLQSYMTKPTIGPDKVLGYAIAQLVAFTEIPPGSPKLCLVTLLVDQVWRLFQFIPKGACKRASYCTKHRRIQGVAIFDNPYQRQLQLFLQDFTEALKNQIFILADVLRE
jgi:hypothetical protein